MPPGLKVPLAVLVPVSMALATMKEVGLAAPATLGSSVSRVASLTLSLLLS